MKQLFDEVPEAVTGSMLEPNGIIQVAEEANWDLVHTVAAWATPSGPVEREVWDAVAGAILEAAKIKGPFDGIVLALHGAMTTVDHADAEGVLLKKLRDIVGLDIPIAITLDLHANVTRLMARHANIICAFRTYPHTDQVATAARASWILDRAMKGEVAPRVHLARRNMLVGLDHGRTTVDNPMTQLMARAEALEEKDPGVLTVSLHAGFTPADFPEVGPSVAVTGDGPVARYRTIAEAYMHFAWEQRHFDSNEYLGAAESMDRLPALVDGTGPVVIADASDNPGAGAYGDSTFLLRAMLDAGLQNAAFGMICDPETAGQFAELLKNAKTILWNGPVGVFEFDQFGNGTKALAEAIAESDAFSLAGGGDTVAAVDKYGVADKISYISTGGGAFLEFVEGKTLPAVAVLEERGA